VPVLDPSGVVKGWAVARAAARFAMLDETDVCLSAGGDVVCRTAVPGSPGWRVGIEDPADPARVVGVVGVRSGAVAWLRTRPGRRGLVVWSDGRTDLVDNLAGRGPATRQDAAGASATTASRRLTFAW
jgi:FAD:protein FMN transferase